MKPKYQLNGEDRFYYNILLCRKTAKVMIFAAYILV